MKPAGIILAAGESSRMGADKALLRYGETTFLGRLIDLFSPRVSPLVVVLGHHAEQIRSAMISRAGIEFTINHNYAAGQISSLQAGIRALPPDAPAALVTLVDHPAARPETLDAILGASAGSLVIPRYQGRRGHPVLFSRPLLDELQIGRASCRERV